MNRIFKIPLGIHPPGVAAAIGFLGIIGMGSLEARDGAEAGATVHEPAPVPRESLFRLGDTREHLPVRRDQAREENPFLLADTTSSSPPFGAAPRLPRGDLAVEEPHPAPTPAHQSDDPTAILIATGQTPREEERTVPTPPLPRGDLARDYVPDPVLEIEDLEEEASIGYYPTRLEWETIGNYYPRGVGTISPDGPGRSPSSPRTMAPSGLYPYPSEPMSFFQRHPGFFGPADNFLGLLTPSDAIVFETANLASYPSPAYLDLSSPYLTRGFNPERATFGISPVYLDVLALSGTILYSDLSGDYDFNFPEDEEAGWLAAITLSLRLTVQLTQNVNLSVLGNIYYLPFSNEVGFYVPPGGIGAALRLAYEKEVGNWWIGVVEQLQVINPNADLLSQWNVDEIERAGRYRFGRADRIGERSGRIFDSDYYYLQNRVGAVATTLLTQNWRLLLEADRRDTWPFDSSKSHRELMQASATASYDGQDWRFAPWLRYQVSTTDNFDTLRNTFRAGVRGPITQRLRLAANAGYTWVIPRGRDGIVGDLGLIHETGPSTRQSIFIGQNYQNDITGDDYWGRYARYTLHQAFGRRLWGSVYAQYADTENLDSGDRYDTLSTGARLTMSVTDLTRLGLGVDYDNARGRGGTRDNRERLILSARVDRPILPGLFAGFLYQFEQVQTTKRGDFNENLFMLTVTQLF